MTYRVSDLIKYLPRFLQEVKELQEMFPPIDDEINILFPYIENIFLEAIIMECSEERIVEWERALKIIPTGTLEERRYFVKALLRGGGKLNEEQIKSIVYAFTGGEAIVSFADSTVTVTVFPPNNGEVYRFPDVERALKPLMPAHLGLTVVRFYSTWKDIKEDFSDWNAVAALSGWGEVKNWIK